MAEWIELLHELLYAVVIAAIPIITKHFTEWVQYFTISTSNDFYYHCIEKIKTIVTSCVRTVNQTYVDALKREGKFTKEEQTKAFNKAKTKILSLLTTDMLNVITEVYSNIDVFLETEIEANVNRLKGDKTNG